jgi:GTP-dependent dephospho-CoA kinase
MSVSVRYRLSDHIRAFLKQPIGYLVNGDDLIHDLEDFDLIISVGDQVSSSLVTQGRNPQLMIIDFKSKRERISKDTHHVLENLDGYTSFRCENPAGVLTQEAIDAVQQVLSKIKITDRMLMIIEGEEDLISLPCILYAPSNATIIYGMPYKGVVIVPATEEYKEKVRLILSKM